ncbi:30S ribosomal protein THX [bacterium]|nr:30S ribosomal protein THX [bacterium]
MGRGDLRSKKGKTKRGSYGKSRPKPAKVRAEKAKKASE